MSKYHILVIRTVYMCSKLNTLAGLRMINKNTFRSVRVLFYTSDIMIVFLILYFVGLQFDSSIGLCLFSPIIFLLLLSNTYNTMIIRRGQHDFFSNLTGTIPPTTNKHHDLVISHFAVTNDDGKLNKDRYLREIL